MEFTGIGGNWGNLWVARIDDWWNWCNLWVARIGDICGIGATGELRIGGKCWELEALMVARRIVATAKAHIATRSIHAGATVPTHCTQRC